MAKLVVKGRTTKVAASKRKKSKISKAKAVKSKRTSSKRSLLLKKTTKPVSANKKTGKITRKPFSKVADEAGKKSSTIGLTDSKRVAELRAMLEARRAEILEEIRQARKSGTDSNQATYAEVGDLVTASVEKERAFEYSEAGIKALREIDLALEKLEQGTYGICELCGKAISVARLKIMPSATLCLECKAKQEQMGGIASRAERHPEIYSMGEGENEID
ncbi:MAG: TraR/DksA family transcriptional regulator [bacterium]